MKKNAHESSSSFTGSQWLTGILTRVQSRELSVEQAMHELRVLPYEDMLHAKIDHHRSLRTGFPEVIYGQGKTVKQITDIAQHVSESSSRILITRVNDSVFRAVKAKIPGAKYNTEARAIVINRLKRQRKLPGIVILTGGTADIPVAEEAAVTAELMGNKVERIYDVGVAGIHRLFAHLSSIRSARVIVAVAGMDGVLPSVVSGLVSCPVIAVPTSIGYGAGFQGIAPLLTMLNSCAPGSAAVNIDGGFNAGYMAGLINRCR